MSSPSTTPLINTRPGEKKRLATAMEAWMRQQILTDDNVLPAMVVSYDRTTNVAQVQPLIKIVKLDNSTISRNPLGNIPVFSLGGGGFHINFPLKKGDLGWLFACDRDIATYMQTLEESPPNSTRVHDFGDAIFLPDVVRKYTILAENEASMVIQSVDGNTFIAISDDVINIKASRSMQVTTEAQTLTGNLTVGESVSVGNGATGSFTTPTGQTVMVQDGIITNIF
jgi:hypothetical protein